jgi:hypothetical protein
MSTMPSAADNAATALPEWDWLEMSVRRLLDDHEAWRRRAELAERRVRELESALREVATGKLDPMALAEHARTLEEQNRDLEQRLQQARESVQRIMARLKFAEEEP